MLVLNVCLITYQVITANKTLQIVVDKAAPIAWKLEISMKFRNTFNKIIRRAGLNILVPRSFMTQNSNVYPQKEITIFEKSRIVKSVLTSSKSILKKFFKINGEIK